MAVPTVKDGERNPYDSGGPFILDLTNHIDFVAPERDTPFLSMVGFGASAGETASASIGANSLQEKCTSFKHSWLNDTLVPSSGTIETAHADAGAAGASGTVDVTAAASLYFRVDDIIRVHSTSVAVAEVDRDLFFIITAINTSNGNLTVTALNEDQTAEVGDSWYLMGNAKVVGAAANTTGKTTVLTQTDNYTQIFQDDATVTGTEEATEQYGITDPMARETEKTFERMVVQFERAVTWGQRISAVPATSATASRMGGFFYYTRTASGALNSDLAGAPITLKAIDDIAQTLWEAGGTPDTLMVSVTGLRELQKFNQGYVRVDKGSMESRAAGLIVDRIETATGLCFDIMLNRHIGKGDFLFVSRNHLGVGPLAGNGVSRHFKAAELPWDGQDSRRVNIRGEYTMEVKNHTTHHYWLYGGSATVSS